MHRATPMDTDDLLYKILTANASLIETLTGGVFVRKRPDDSNKEDIVVNTIDLDRQLPATGTSNVNIHVPDLRITHNGKQQYEPNRERLRELTNEVLAALDDANPYGIGIEMRKQTIISEDTIHQHYMNIRVQWTIAIKIE